MGGGVINHVCAKHGQNPYNKNKHNIPKGPHIELTNEETIQTGIDFGFIQIIEEPDNSNSKGSETKLVKYSKRVTCEEKYPMEIGIIGHIARKRRELDRITSLKCMRWPDKFPSSGTLRTNL